MNKLYSVLLVLCFAHSAFSFIIAPTILNPNSEVNRTICQDDQLEGAYDGEPNQLVGPYLSCVNDARLIIHEAYLLESTPGFCPLQYVGANRGIVCNDGNSPKKVDVWEELRARCDGLTACFFSFDTLFPSISCRVNGYNSHEYSKGKLISRDYQMVEVVYSCQLVRPKFRPFRNKLNDPKFTRNLLHPYRKLSYNHLQSL